MEFGLLLLVIALALLAAPWKGTGDLDPKVGFVTFD
jgi:hypothetical protein